MGLHRLLHLRRLRRRLHPFHPSGRAAQGRAHVAGVVLADRGAYNLWKDREGPLTCDELVEEIESKNRVKMFANKRISGVNYDVISMFRDEI